MIKTETININGKAMEGVCITALGGEDHPNMLVLVGSKGYVMCGYLNLEAAAGSGDAACVISGSSLEELLANPVKAVTPEAEALGIRVGMTGAEVCRDYL